MGDDMKRGRCTVCTTPDMDLIECGDGRWLCTNAHVDGRPSCYRIHRYNIELGPPLQVCAHGHDKAVACFYVAPTQYECDILLKLGRLEGMSARAQRQHAAVGVKVQGRCPSCRNESLFLGENGYVTCAVIGGCKHPGAATDILFGRPWNRTEEQHRADLKAPYIDPWGRLEVAVAVAAAEGEARGARSRDLLVAAIAKVIADAYSPATAPKERPHLWLDRFGKPWQHGEAVFSDSDVRCSECRALYIDPITMKMEDEFGCPGKTPA